MASLDGRKLRLTLSDGRVVERDVSALLQGKVFERIAVDDDAFRRVTVMHGTAAWPEEGADIAPETLIWGGPEPADGSARVPPATLAVKSPNEAVRTAEP